jgi:ParB/RepB/Spo0J family partition protein
VSALAAVPRETSAPADIDPVPARRAKVADLAPSSRPASAHLEDLPLELVDVAENVRVDPGELEELAASIRELGVLQPIRAIGPGPDGRYRAVWGQRRILASRIAERTTIPALVEPEADVDQVGARRSIEQLVENIQRADLGPIDEAYALRQVLDADAGLTQAALAKRLGRSAPWVANSVGLLEAPAEIRDWIAKGELTASHAKALKGLAKGTQVELAKRAVREARSAHQLEADVQDHKRSEEWRKEREAAAAKTSKAAQERRVAALANLEKKKVPKDAQIVVDGRYYGGDGKTKRIVESVAALGYTNVREGSASSRPKGGLCDCTAWRVELKYDGGLTIAPSCVKDAHLRAQTQAEDDARRAKWALENRVHARLAEVLLDEVASVGPRAARIALWITLSWSIDDWTKAQDARLINTLDESKPKRKKRDPWATLTETSDEDVRAELAKTLARRLSDGNFKVGWEQLATELGVLEEPAPKRGKKAAAS